MSNNSLFSILTVRLRHERHVVQARQRAREISALLGFEHAEQIRLATATSELARNAFRYANDGAVEFFVRDASPQAFVIAVTDTGPGIQNLQEILNGRYASRTGLGKGLIGTKRLMDWMDIQTSQAGTRVEVGKKFSPAAARITAEKIRKIAVELVNSSTADPFDEVERQNQELLRTLAELREKQEQLVELNRELEDTNRGVVALYAELDRNADDLRRVSDLKSSFLSNLSHEFRTPLNSITSLCQLLLDRADGDLSADQEKQVTYIQRSAGELTEFVNDLLDLAKVEAGKTDIKPKHFEVQDLFGALRGMLRPLLSSSSLELIFEAAPDIPPLYTDEGKLSQILRNLISNALKFTRRGYVRVSAQSERNGFVHFQVEDTGIGIASDDIERIFDEFVQVESEMQTRVKGTGLGLPLSRKMIGLLGGSLTAESQPGVGSTFHVRLPIYLRQPQTETAAKPLIEPGSGPTVLFVEDNRETSFIHETSLKTSPYSLVFTTNIPEARATIRSVEPAVVVLDRFLDEEDSLPFIDELKRNGYRGPVLVTSIVNDEKAALDAGAKAFLPKPVAPFKLASTLHELIEGQASNTLLLVDDDEVTRYLLGDALSKMGYDIVEAQNGRQAIQLAESHILHGVVLDIMMPDLTGFQVLRELRRKPLTQEVPVIIHTSKDLSAKEIGELRQLGAIFFPKREFSSAEGAEQLRDVLAAAGLRP